MAEAVDKGDKGFYSLHNVSSGNARMEKNLETPKNEQYGPAQTVNHILKRCGLQFIQTRNFVPAPNVLRNSELVSS